MLNRPKNTITMYAIISMIALIILLGIKATVYSNDLKSATHELSKCYAKH